MKAAHLRRTADPVRPRIATEVSTRLFEAEQALRAIGLGEADVVVTGGSKGIQVLEQQGAEQAYRLLIESMNEGAVSIAADSMVLYCNSCFARMVKSPLERVIGSMFSRYLTPADRLALEALVLEARRGGSKIQVDLVCANASRLPVQISISSAAGAGGGARTVGLVVADLTEARRTQDRLRALTHAVVSAQEEERGRVAIELHDGAVQLLCALMYSSQALIASLPPMNNGVRVEAEKLRDIASKAADEVDRVSRNLRPGVLDQLGLSASLNYACREFAARTGVLVKLTNGKLSGRLQPDRELTLYRILQETLRNVEKHAHARHVKVSLTEEGGFAVLVISDDGTGFDPERKPVSRKGRGGFGVFGMRERALYVGGDFKLKSSKGSGTEVSLSVPL